MADHNFEWHEIKPRDAEGRGWEGAEKPFGRFPARAKGVVTDEVYNHGHDQTGMCVHFETDSPEIQARWTLEKENLGESNFNVVACSGLDLYVWHQGRWRWVGAPKHNTILDRNPRAELAQGLPKARRKFRLYLPMRNPLVKLELGCLAGSSFKPIAPRRKGVLVHYGSSIVHGAYSARPGLGQAQIVARRLGLPLVNLGFSGSAKMEAPLAALMGELDAKVFVIDALPNMDAKLVSERAVVFLTTLAKARPRTPILVVEDPVKENAWLFPQAIRGHHEKWKALAAAFDSVRKAGFKNLHYLKGEGFMGRDGECSIDGIHPTDVGMERMADQLEKTLRRILKK